MDAERIAGYEGTQRRETPGPAGATGSPGTAGYQDTGSWERAAGFGAVPGQRGEPGQAGPAALGAGTAALDAGTKGRDADAAGTDGITADAAEVDGIDVRCEPLVVRDGCSPDRIPPGRWPSDGCLVRSEQFAVNEAIARRGLFAVHAPPGTGVAEVFGDLVAAIITERARRIAELPSPAAAFGESRTWSAHRVAVPNPALTGFEIVLAAPEPSALTAHGLPPIGAGWRDAAAAIDYFSSTARLSDGVGAWAMLAARLGDGNANRAFAERWWRGAIRGTDVLFPAGESMAAALRRLKQESPAVDWPAAVARFRVALARAQTLASERTGVAAAVTRISDLEQACEEASCAGEAAQARLAEITEREPSVRAAVAAAEEEHRARLADLGAHELGRPVIATVTADGKAALRSSSALSVALAGGLRRGRNWRQWSAGRRKLRDACAAAEARRAAAVAAAAAHDAALAAAQAAVSEATAEVTRLTADLGPLAEAVAAARQLWGDHVPDGPSQAETEDAALIEWRETSAPWADEEYATARAEVFLAALELHKALITAQADVFAANLGALMDLLSADQADPLHTNPTLIPAQASRAGAENRAEAENTAGAKVADGLWGAERTTRTAAKETEESAQTPAEIAGGVEGAAGTARSAAKEPDGTTLVAAEDADATGRADPADDDNGDGHEDGDETALIAAEPLTAAIAAAWQAFFLLVPVVHVPFGAIGTLFGDLGPARLGWLLADRAERLPARQARGVLGRVNQAVFAGDTATVVAPALAANRASTNAGAASVDSAQRLAERTALYGTWLRSGLAAAAINGVPTVPGGSAESGKPTDGAGRLWVGTPLRVVRGLDRATVDLRNELAYDGLLVSDRDLAVRR
ncbi:MAG: hypothetical protein ABSA02_21000 [Trebonia sp.]